jgi:hypothetical protein
MGVSYRPLLAVGKWFEDESEAKEYYEDKVEKIPENEDYEETLGDYLYDKKGDLQGTWLDHYSPYGYVLGYKVSLQPYESLAERIQGLQKKFKDVFGEDAEVHSEVVFS